MGSGQVNGCGGRLGGGLAVLHAGGAGPGKSREREGSGWSE